MRKNWLRVVSVVVSTIMLLSAASCMRQEEEQKETDEIKIGVSIYRGDDAFLSSLYRFMEKEVKEKEEETGKKITLILTDAKNSQISQNDQLEDFIKKDYDIICPNLVDRTVASSIIGKAKEAGIPLVLFNREPVKEDMDIWDQTFYVGSDAKEAGILAGSIVANSYEDIKDELDKNKDGKIQYVLLEGDQGHQDALMRTEYAIKTISNAGIELERLANGTANWMRGYAYGIMTDWVKEFGNEIELVLSNNDDMAIGAIEAIDENSDIMSHTFVVGTDGTVEGIEMVDKGKMLGTVKNDAKGQAEAIIDIAYEVATNGNVNTKRPKLKNRVERIPQYVITKENIYDFMN